MPPQIHLSPGYICAPNEDLHYKVHGARSLGVGNLGGWLAFACGGRAQGLEASHAGLISVCCSAPYKRTPEVPASVLYERQL